MMTFFPPMTRASAVARGWPPAEGSLAPEIHGVNVVFVTGDACVENPSVANAVTVKMLESKGYRVGVLAQSHWRSKDAFELFGVPRIAWLTSSGSLDSMWKHSTAHKCIRNDNQHSPSAQGGLRPDCAKVIVGQSCRKVGRGVPIIIVGVVVYLDFEKRFKKAPKRGSKEQYLVPSSVPSHSGCDAENTVDLAEFLKARNGKPRHVQGFMLAPGAPASCQWWTGIDSYLKNSVWVGTRVRRKKKQRALLQHGKPGHDTLSREALTDVGRGDLVETGRRAPAPSSRHKDKPPMTFRMRRG